MKFFTLLAVSFSITTQLWAQECSHLWRYNLSTDSLKAKGSSGDTSAAYIWLPFKPQKNLRFVIKGKFPASRFISLETYEGRFNSSVDTLLDFQMVADSGSSNPYLEGVDMQTPNREFTIDLVPQNYQSNKANSMKLASGIKVQSFLYRIYSPSKGETVTMASLPKVFAYDTKTGAERACPKGWDMKEYVNVPQFIANLVIQKKEKIEFKASENFDIGANAAIPAYLWAANEIKQGDASVIRFKAPKFMDTTSGSGPFPTQSETRYWSLCFQNFPHNETLSCLPDHLAKPDKDGFVTLIHGGGAEVKALAEGAGFNYIADSRQPNQKVLGFVYRNIIPSEEFAKTKMHKGDYLPRGIVCSSGDFLAKKCGWNF